MGPTTLARARRSALLCIALLAVGCGERVNHPDADPEAGWVHLVEPVDGDSLGGRIEIIAEVDLGELVHRVTFYVDDTPIVVATQTPWTTDWLPPATMVGKVVHFRAEAIGASRRVTSSPVAVWIAPRRSGARIVGPRSSAWIERNPRNFLELRTCSNGSEGRIEPATDWTGDHLERAFHSDLLPVALLPPALQKVRAIRGAEHAEGWVRPFDYPGSHTPLAAAESLTLAMRARDSERVGSGLAPNARFDGCGDRILPSLQGDTLSAALRRFLDDPEIVDLAWSWRLTEVGAWSRDGASFALVRADNFRWSFGRALDPCEGDPTYDWTQSGAGGGELVWSRASDGRWLLDRWTDHIPRDQPAFLDHLLTDSEDASGSRREPRWRSDRCPDRSARIG